MVINKTVKRASKATKGQSDRDLLAIKNFFTKTVPQMDREIANFFAGKKGKKDEQHIKNFFERDIPKFGKKLEKEVKGIPQANRKAGQDVKNFFEKDVKKAGDSAGKDIKTYFTKTVPKMAKATGGDIKNFFDKTVPDAGKQTVKDSVHKINHGSGGQKAEGIVGLLPPVLASRIIANSVHSHQKQRARTLGRKKR